MTRFCVLLALLTGCSLQDFDSLQGGDAGTSADADLVDAGPDTNIPPVDAGPDTNIPPVDAGPDTNMVDAGTDANTPDAGPACDDNVLNGDETDLDCGGGSCDPCVRGNSCLVDTDCAESVCYSLEEGGATTCERVTFIRGTTAESDVVLSFLNGGLGDLTRVAFDGPPMVTRFDGAIQTLPAPGDESFDQIMITPALPNSTITVVDTALTGHTGGVWYQTQANIGFYGVLLLMSDDTSALMNETTLNAAVSANTAIEIVIVDRSPTCGDGFLNGNETDTDCGGSCGPCILGDSCREDGDCLNSTCYPPAGTCELVTYVRGTAAPSDAVMSFPADSLFRIDFLEPPTATLADGGGLVLATHPKGEYAEGRVTDNPATVMVNGTVVQSPTGISDYQTIADDGFYGLAIGVANSASATANGNTLSALELEGGAVEIIFLENR